MNKTKKTTLLNKVGHISLEAIMVGFVVLSTGAAAVTTIDVTGNPVLVNLIDKTLTLMGFNPYSPVIETSAEMEYDERGYAKSLKITPADVNPTADFVLQYNPTTDSYVVVGYTNLNDLNIVIPRVNTDGKYITEIGERAFMGKGIQSVAIPDTITEIRDKAFYMNELASVIVPRSVKVIGKHSFYHNKLKKVYLDKGVTKIGDNAFEENDLTTLTLPDTITTLDNSVFQNNELVNVTFEGETPDELGNSIFTSDNNGLGQGSIGVPPGQVDNYKSNSNKFDVDSNAFTEKKNNK